jgi:rhodanese-related sulfurtransferase
LAAAQLRGFQIIDIRTDEEVAAAPSGATHIPMPQLLADPALLDAVKQSGREVLLLCASGKRSLAAARQLRQRGISARSVAGGLQRLEAELAVQK